MCVCVCVRERERERERERKCLPNIFGPDTFQYYGIRPRFHLGDPGCYDPRRSPNYVHTKAKPVVMLQRIELTQDRTSLLRSHTLIHFIFVYGLFIVSCCSSKCTAE